jgi:tRNA uridine 5-carbamoylmethylation protein Kti12
MVTTVLSLLHESRFVHIRGTPASGKTTLCNLLAHKIRNNKPHAQILKMVGWDEKKAVQAGDWNIYLQQRTGLYAEELMSAAGDIYLLVDEAQTTYCLNQPRTQTLSSSPVLARPVPIQTRKSCRRRHNTFENSKEYPLRPEIFNWNLDKL